MRVIDIIAKMRKRLRDEEKQWWSDEELHDAINDALSAMAHRLQPWKSRWSFIASSGVDTYSIPEDFMAPISLVVDGVMIPILGIENALRSTEEMTCGFIDNDSLILSPMPSDTTVVVFNYKAIYLPRSKADIIKLPPETTDTMMAYALSQAYQKQGSEDALKQSQYYLSVYESRCSDIAKTMSQRRNTTHCKSVHQKV